MSRVLCGLVVAWGGWLLLRSGAGSLTDFVGGANYVNNVSSAGRWL